MKNQFLPADLRAYVKTYYIKTWVLFLGLVVAFGLILFFFGNVLFGELLLWQRILVYSLVMLSTVFISGLPQRLWNRTFYGKVERVGVKTTYVDYNYRGHWEPPTENHVILWISTPDGKHIKRRVRSVALTTSNNQNQDNLPKCDVDGYKQGDSVLHLAGTSCTVVLPKTCDSHTMCAVCGKKNLVEAQTCKDCGHTLVKKLEIF